MIAQAGGYLIFMTIGTIIRVRSLIRLQKNKEAAVYGGLMGLSAIVGTLILAEVQLPSPIVPFKAAFEPIGKLILRR